MSRDDQDISAGSGMSRAIAAWMFCVTASALVLHPAHAQFDFAGYPRTVSSFGLGEQGSASREPADAFSFNPAALAWADGPQVQLFRNPFYSACCGVSPLTAAFVAAPLSENVAIGMEYQHFRRGSVATLVEDRLIVKELWDWSVGGAASIRISPVFTAGAGFLYAQRIAGSDVIGTVLYSAGMQARFSVVGEQATIGLAVANAGPSTAIVDVYAPGNEASQVLAPSVLRLGLQAPALRSAYAAIRCVAEVSRSLGRMEGQPTPFSDVNDEAERFPQDFRFHGGVVTEVRTALTNRSLEFGADFYIGGKRVLQRLPSRWLHGLSFAYTSGFRALVGFRSWMLSAGVAVSWYDETQWHYLSTASAVLPREMFEFRFRAPLQMRGGAPQSTGEAPGAASALRVFFGAEVISRRSAGIRENSVTSEAALSGSVMLGNTDDAATLELSRQRTDGGSLTRFCGGWNHYLAHEHIPLWFQASAGLSYFNPEVQPSANLLPSPFIAFELGTDFFEKEFVRCSVSLRTALDLLTVLQSSEEGEGREAFVRGIPQVGVRLQCGIPIAL